jgi:hypothetical protein
MDDIALFELDQRRANAYAESGYWPDAKNIARALVKVEAGRTLGLNPLVAMNEIHVIDGKPTLGAGAWSSLIKASGRYDYRILELTDQRCQLRFYDRGTPVGDSVFTIEDAKRAGLDKKQNYHQYPRNMLFARAVSNGGAWFCPDVTMGSMYVPEDFGIADYNGAPEIEAPSTHSTEEYNDAPASLEAIAQRQALIRMAHDAGLEPTLWEVEPTDEPPTQAQVDESIAQLRQALGQT